MSAKEEKAKQAAELSEEELDGVSGGLNMGFTGASTMQYQPGMDMGASTMQFRPGANPMQPQTLEQQMSDRLMKAANPSGTSSAPKGPSGAHSV